MKRKVWQIALGLAVSGGVLAWVVAQTDAARIKEAFQALSPVWIGPLIVLYLGSFGVRGLRWQLMLRPLRPVAWSQCTSVVITGYMANNILPLRLGEIVRAVLLERVEQIPTSSALSSIGLERILDGLVLVGVLGIVLLTHPFESPVVHYVGAAASLLFGVALLIVGVARWRPERCRQLARWGAGFAPTSIQDAVVGVVDDLLQGIQFFSWNLTTAAVVLLSVVVWTLEGSVFWLGLHAFGLPADLYLAMLTLAFVNLSILVPSAPGYVGVFQGSTILAFAAFGIGESQALTYSLVIHATHYLPITSLGLVILSYYGLSLSWLRSTSTRSTENPVSPNS